jgi:hypothetical protein
LGTSGSWRPKNEQQKFFIDRLFNFCRTEVSDINEIESIASMEAGVINDFLKIRGYLIQLRPFDSETFGVASVWISLSNGGRKDPRQPSQRKMSASSQQSRSGRKAPRCFPTQIMSIR